MIGPNSSVRKRVFLAILVGAATTVAAGEARKAGLDEAVRLYDAGRYAEARPLLEAAVATGKADGITHYRLFFCQRDASDPVQNQTLAAARSVLEKELVHAERFDIAFYLSSTYSNLGLTEEVKRLAGATTARFEAGEIPEPVSAVEQFRLAKLYSDHGTEAGATRWFARAVEGFAATPDEPNRAYFQWSARWLGERAITAERYEAAADYYAHAVTAGTATTKDLDNLGLACLMIGRYPQAIDAWNRALRSNPTEANRYRYGTGLANLAQMTPDLPISPDGERSWEEIGRQELEQLMKDQGHKVREVKAEIEAAASIPPESRAAFQARLDEPRPLFVAAALEYTRRGLSLREAAFFGGYAPLIFRTRNWKATGDQQRGKRTREEARARSKEWIEKKAAEKRKAAEQEEDD